MHGGLFQKPDTFFNLLSTENVVHQGMSCGSCGVKGFRGLRYKSDKSKNFHLCQWCFWRGRIPLEHRDDVFKEFNTFSKSSLSSYGGGSLKKSLQCLSGGKRRRFFFFFLNLHSWSNVGMWIYTIHARQLLISITDSTARKKYQSLKCKLVPIRPLALKWYFRHIKGPVYVTPSPIRGHP